MTPLEKMQKDFEDSLEEHAQEIERLNSEIKATSRRLVLFYVLLAIALFFGVWQVLKFIEDGNLPS